MSERGKYIVIEGHDGTGKSAQRDFLAKKLNSEFEKNVVTVSEPGSTAIGTEIRKVIKDGKLKRDGLTNLLLFTADRRELWTQIISPALESGQWVVSDRNWYSTIAYQGGGEGIDAAQIEKTTREYVGADYLTPDLALVLSLNNETVRKERAHASGDTEIDTFEQRDAEFQARVSQAYLELANKVGAKVIEFTSDNNKPEVHRMICNYVQPLYDESRKD